jgi:hypothetical protein
MLFGELLGAIVALACTRLAAISAVVRRLKRGSASGATGLLVWPLVADGGTGRASCLVQLYAGRDARHVGGSADMASLCSYAQANAMASSRVSGCSNSMFVFSGSRRPTVKILI